MSRRCLDRRSPRVLPEPVSNAYAATRPSAARHRLRHLVPDLGALERASVTRTSSIRPAKVLAVGRVAADPQRIGGNLDAPAHRMARHLSAVHVQTQAAPSYVTATYDQRSIGKIGRSAGVLDRAVEGAAAGRHQGPASFLGHHAREQQEHAEHDRRHPAARLRCRGALVGVWQPGPRQTAIASATRGNASRSPVSTPWPPDSESTTGPCQFSSATIPAAKPSRTTTPRVGTSLRMRQG